MTAGSNSQRASPGQCRQMFVAKANGQVVAYGRILKLAAEEAGPGTPAGYYLSGVLVDPAWQGRGIGSALAQRRLHWAFARTGSVFHVTGADNTASLRLHTALGFEEIKRFDSERSAVGVDVLSQLERTGPLHCNGTWMIPFRIRGAR